VSAAVAALAMVADGGVVTALVLAAGMFGFQVSIGALNDLVDADRDRLAGADKPIPAGLVSRRVAMVVVVAGASTGLAVSASFGGAVLLVGLLGAGSGYAYDLVARRAGLGWITFAVALPALLVWVWLAAAGTLPPESMVLLPLAALAGPAVHLANSMADTDDDQQTGATSLATRLGPHRSRRVLVGLDLVIWALAWLGLVLLAPLSAGALLLTSVATVVAGVGALASISARTASSDLGWTLGALALAMVAVIWVATLGTA
jgi:4-hydroxybenzoate polyprenyltransferase